MPPFDPTKIHAWKEFLELLLILVALPWVVYKLVTDPLDFMRKRAEGSGS